MNKKILIKCLIFIWILGVLITVPFLWITDYVKDEDECDLYLTLAYLIYILGLNVIFVLLPMFLLTYLYICIIIKSKKNYILYKNTFNLIKISDKITSTDQSKISCEYFHEKKYNIRKFSSIHEISETMSATAAPKETINLKKSANKSNLNNDHFNRVRLTSLKMNDRLSKSSIELNACMNTSLFISKSMKSSSTSSLESTLFIIKLKAKQKHVKTAKICLLTILAFCFQFPIRFFICWSYLNSYSSKFGSNYYGNFVENNSKTISIYFNVSTLIYFFNFVFNSFIYNIFSDQFRKAFLSFIGFKKI